MSSTHANALTAHWAALVDGRQTVLSGAGAYPLLAPPRHTVCAPGGSASTPTARSGSSPCTAPPACSWLPAG
ncbi:hypothetical protein [Micromonospora sp. NPDC050200]|uniref:hypothetical protein n=1 Tax=Micromonospora sp. NPDC050200 TaxID=3155664 RepID=UPI0033DE3BF3